MKPLSACKKTTPATITVTGVILYKADPFKQASTSPPIIPHDDAHGIRDDVHAQHNLRLNP